MAQKENSKGLTLTRGIALFVCYFVATGFLGASLAFATFYVMYPLYGNAMRPLGFAGLFLAVVLLGSFAIPVNRHQAGALILRTIMVWSLLVGSGVISVQIKGPANRYGWIAFGISAAPFFVGVYVSRWTRWGRKWLAP